MIILICSSLMKSDTENIFICLLVNGVSFFVKNRFESLPITKKKKQGCLLLLLSCRTLKKIYSGYKPVSDICFMNIFFQSVTCTYIFLMVYFNNHVFKILIKSNSSSFSFIVITFCVLCKNVRTLCPLSGHKYIFLFFRSFIALAFTFRSMIYLELMFVSVQELWLIFSIWTSRCFSIIC